ncbi:MAG: hypothetical protein AB7K09_11815 [Planctomycetota bacterium]
MLIVVGLMAAPAGAAFVADPGGGALGMTTALLAGSPFNDFMIPGLVLLLLHGGTGIVAGVASLNGWRHGGIATAVLGVAMVIWIAVQVAVVGFSWLQPVFATVGLVEIGMGVAAWKSAQRWPAA